ncbi:hypothetical protein C0039_18685 [Pseudohalioglobus lutimaris]|uniref:O-antigen ligase-related domain-containing protein n=1 Tax=Pseudohalioglobus lutimaris TaxID=1737061 RepID=A0A2N5WXU7_9GAMM|nr:hypothetical protein C0039_18685 [Pseudohalioglobus lutimaris]
MGLLLIFAGIFYQYVIRRQSFSIFSSPFSWLFFAYLFLVLIQAPLASINFNQSVLNGLVAVRQQFYYLSFFLFISVLKTPSDVFKFMKILTILSVIALILAAIDTFGPNIVRNQFDMGDGVSKIRSSIAVPTVPALNLISVIFLWQVSIWSFATDKSTRFWGRFLTVFLAGAHVWQQGRWRLLSIVVAALSMLVLKRRIKLLFSLVLVGITAVVIAEYRMETNIFLNPFISGMETVKEQKGSAAARMRQLEVDLEIFEKYPYVGGGTLAIRVNESDFSYRRKEEISRKADLGYTHLLKHLGILGIVWLVFFYILLWVYTILGSKNLPPEHQSITAFGYSYLVYFIVSFVMENHLMFPHSIILVCLVAAILSVASGEFNGNGEANSNSTKSGLE